MSTSEPINERQEGLFIERREGYWECTGGCGRLGSEEDHTLDDDEGRCMDCQEELGQ